VGYFKSVTASGGSAVQLQTSLKAPVAVETITAPMTRLSFGGIDYPRATDLNVGRASQRLPRKRARARARAQQLDAALS